MIGPGAPDAANSGLGIVADELRRVLTTKVKLVSVEPADLNKQKQEPISSVITEKEVVEDLVRVSVTESLDSYSYFEPTTYFDTKVVSSEVKKKYDEFTEAVVTVSNDYDFDLIYVHDWVGMEAAMILQEESAKPLVIHIHSLDVDRLGANHKSWVFDIERSAIEKADAIISVSNYTKQKIIDQYHGDPAKVKVVYPALPEFDRSALEVAPIDKTVLFLGRFSSQKRPLKFVEIAEAVIKKNKNIHFLMVGDGDLKEEVVEKVAQKSLGGRIHFSDYIAHDELGKVFARTSVLCITSDSEPFGLTALEAAEVGIPVIISAQSGASEVLSGAITVDKDDIDGFAKEISKLLANEKTRSKVIEKNKVDVSKLNWQNAAEQIVEVFREVVK
jgi:glycosyltransferase involved in cell wall biosynthesis